MEGLVLRPDTIVTLVADLVHSAWTMATNPVVVELGHRQYLAGIIHPDDHPVLRGSKSNPT